MSLQDGCLRSKLWPQNVLIFVVVFLSRRMAGRWVGLGELVLVPRYKFSRPSWIPLGYSTARDAECYGKNTMIYKGIVQRRLQTCIMTHHPSAVCIHPHSSTWWYFHCTRWLSNWRLELEMNQPYNQQRGLDWTSHTKSFPSLLPSKDCWSGSHMRISWTAFIIMFRQTLA